MSSAGTAQIAGAQSLWPLLVYAIAVALTLAAILIVGRLLGSPTRRTPGTELPYESGIVPVGSAETLRLSVEFYLIAMFFVIFDLETIFIFAWAVAFRDLGWHGFAAAAVFIGVLFAALIYEWRTGALDWGSPARRAAMATEIDDEHEVHAS